MWGSEGAGKGWRKKRREGVNALGEFICETWGSFIVTQTPHVSDREWVVVRETRYTSKHRRRAGLVSEIRAPHNPTERSGSLHPRLRVFV